jgi:hypothetical protein
MISSPCLFVCRRDYVAWAVPKFKPAENPKRNDLVYNDIGKRLSGGFFFNMLPKGAGRGKKMAKKSPGGFCLSGAWRFYRGKSAGF